MGLSSNILWHQTNYNSLRKIIRSKRILCAYSIEDVADIVGQELAFPMVSMCDLPLSEFTEYQGKYGDYSIGLSREWGIKNRFTPLWYYESKSRVPQLLKKQFENAVASGDGSILSLIGVVSYMKKTEGPLPKHNYSTYRFYDEREVRYVPSFEYLVYGGEKPVLTRDEYDQYKAAHQNVSTINASVSFDWKDVRYIIVKEEKQIATMIDYLAKQGCDNKTIAVFSAKQVYQDFIGYKHNVEIPLPAPVGIDRDMAREIVRLTLEELAKMNK